MKTLSSILLLIFFVPTMLIGNAFEVSSDLSFENTALFEEFLKKEKKTKKDKQGMFAIIETNKGEIKIKLEFEKAPLTVANFVGLVNGEIENSKKSKGTPYYDGLNFHRVISKSNGDRQDFMIQGGCPDGNGRGNPGYSFQDEFHNSLKHDKPGTLSMANSGPNTNGSQFFITVIPTPHLDNKHAVFGYVIEGQDIVTNEIKKDDKIIKITIKSIGKAAKKFKAAKVFEEKATRVPR